MGNLSKSNFLIGFINTSIKGLKIAQGKEVTRQQVIYLIDAVLVDTSIGRVKQEVSEYCRENYNY